MVWTYAKHIKLPNYPFQDKILGQMIEYETEKLSTLGRVLPTPSDTLS